MSQDWFEDHLATLEGALHACETRECWSPYPEVPSGKIYGETAREDGLRAWKDRLGKPFPTDQPGTIDWIDTESSPYGIETGVSYPRADLDVLLPAVQDAMNQNWRHTPIESRTGICLEILHRLNRRSFEIAFAVMHTTGQGFMMAFQAGGPHAQDRGLEAVAWAYREMTRCPASATWTKRVSKTETVTLEKTWRVVPRGVAATIGCSTFPTWNGYPGIFASLMTGNGVVIKPHPGAVLPLAITVEIAREVLKEAGIHPDLICLACDSVDEPIAQNLVVRDEVGIVDYTGGSEFGTWIESNAGSRPVYTEKAGVNSIILDSCEDVRDTTGNIAFSLCLYSGQMCTTPQNIYIPTDGIDTAEGHLSFDEISGAIVKAVDWFVSDPGRAAEVLGAVQSEATADRVCNAATEGATVLRASEPIDNERFPQARTATPLILQVEQGDIGLYAREVFGPIVYIVRVEDTHSAIEQASMIARSKGALTAAVWSRNPDVLDHAADELTAAGVATSCNLSGQIWVNQSAAFSDFHASGMNPAGNATLCDGAFVSDRFRFVASRIPVPAPVDEAVT